MPERIIEYFAYLNLALVLAYFIIYKKKKPTSVKPFYITLYFSAVLSILFIIAAHFPAEGIKLGKEIKIQFSTLEEIFSADEDNASQEFGKVKDIINLSAEELAAEMNEKAIEADTIDFIPPVKDKMSFLQLQFPNGDRSILYPAFESFEQAATANQPARILHYGDSQIENDRITSYLRNEMQKKFGGSGPGMIPVLPFYSFAPFTYKLDYSGNWTSYSQFWNKKVSLDHARYGAMANFCQFTPYVPDSLPHGIEEQEAWLTVEGSRNAFGKARSFQRCRIFYGHNPTPFYAELNTDNQFIDANTYPPSTRLNTITWRFDQPVSNIQLKFKGSASPQIFGIALDGLNGVAVDNIAMRGNSGLFFTRLDAENLRQHYASLNVKMIILQFGGNIVPDVTDNYIAYYERIFYKQIMKIREILPDVAIVVIGVADMSVKVKTHFESYPKLDKIRDAMKAASFKAGAAYWDMYQAMGGHNSMPSWVNEGLGTDDYVHLTPKGARLIATMFAGAIFNEYNYYKKQITPTETKTETITETEIPAE